MRSEKPSVPPWRPGWAIAIALTIFLGAVCLAIFVTPKALAGLVPLIYAIDRLVPTLLSGRVRPAASDAQSS